VMAVIIQVVNPNYLKPLLENQVGHFLIGMGVVLQIAGMLVIRKIVRIKI
jgi:tight adherence protein B